MILKHNNKVVTYFKDRIDVPNPPSAFGVSFSGGVDSTLAYYCAVKSISMYNKQDKISIYGVHALQSDNPLDTVFLQKSIKEVTYLWNYIASLFPDVKVHKLELIDCTESNEKFQRFFSQYRKEWFKKKKLPKLAGSSCNPPIGVIPELDLKLKNNPQLSNRNADYYRYLTEKHGFSVQPWHTVDKSFLAEIYKQEKIMDDVFPFTHSCGKMEGDGPCKKCFWCLEKKWAFGMYDGCVI